MLGPIAFMYHKVNPSSSLDINWHFEYMEIRLCWHTGICWDICLPRILTEVNMLGNFVYLIAFQSDRAFPLITKHQVMKNLNASIVCVSLWDIIWNSKGSSALEACAEIRGERLVSGLVWKTIIITIIFLNQDLTCGYKLIITDTKGTSGPVSVFLWALCE